jgi:zinc and cadmium transporter
MEWIAPLLAVTSVSLLSLLGILFLVLNKALLTRILSPLVAISSGVLLGSAFFDLIPEGVELLDHDAFIYVIAGIIGFFAIEKVLQWHHHIDGDHHDRHEHKAAGYLSLLGDGIHNFIDGIIIGAAFLVSVPLGISATIAVIAHEIPHELADFSILIHSGFSNAKALLYNFLSASTAILGTVFVLLLGQTAQTLVPYLIPVSAGGFLYIAMSDLIPELHRPKTKVGTLMQVLLLTLGAFIIFSLPHHD